ncbi:MAG: alpha/beta hydrolase [Burkholderiales bacterium]|jgi:acetyl esterase/lipase|nr:alpha/beta hydrolase [Burkholderiales bacterium]
MTLAYNPDNLFAVKVWEVEFRKTDQRTLIARIYQPQGTGPFPVLLDLHGGAWSRKDRYANEPMARAIAAAGMLVVSPDLRLSHEAPYPASVQDANYAIRWLKHKSKEWNADPATLGVLGSSSGGHIAQLLGMRQHDARYAAIPLPEAPHIDATFSYIATRSPISNPVTRRAQAEKKGNKEMMKKSDTYFSVPDSIHDGNPQEILDRREKVTLLPMLIMQGGHDDNVIPPIQEKFAATYRAAGGECQLEIFEGCEHEWTAVPGPDADRSHAMVKAFIAKQLRALQKAA